MLFSIITATYQAAQTLPPTLQSIRQQTCQDFEHIIVDGASTDGTLQIFHAYRQQCPAGHQPVVSSEPDQGLYDALNKGIARAQGEYLIFMNAGDTFHANDTLEQVSRLLEQQEKHPGVVYGETDIVDNDGNYLHPRRLRAPRKLSWKSFRNGMLVCHQSFYARRDLAPRYDLHYRFSADIDWCIRVMKAAEKRQLVLLNTGLILTNYREEGLTTKNHRASLLERYRIMVKYYGRITTILMHLRFVFRNIKTHPWPLP